MLDVSDLIELICQRSKCWGSARLPMGVMVIPVRNKQAGTMCRVCRLVKQKFLWARCVDRIEAFANPGQTSDDAFATQALSLLAMCRSAHDHATVELV
jgi:hypothetical protein